MPDTLTPLPGPLPTVANADLLAEWDLKTVDFGSAAPGDDCSAALPVGKENQLYRGCSCTYTLSLSVGDKTVTQTVFDYIIHHPSTSIPIKITNDL